MSVSNGFKKIVADETLLNVKVTLKQYALLDKTLNMFNEALNYAYEILGNELIVKHDGEQFNTNKDEWNEDYAIGIASDLVFNFSQERIDHMREVFKAVFPNAKPYGEEGSARTASARSAVKPGTEKIIGERITGERIIEKGNRANSSAENRKTNPNGERVREIPGSARRKSSSSSKPAANAVRKTLGVALAAGGVTAVVAGAIAGSGGVVAAGAVAAVTGTVVTVASSNKKD